MLPDTVDNADKEMARFMRVFKNVSGGGIPGVPETETIEPADPRRHDPEFDLPQSPVN